MDPISKTAEAAGKIADLARVLVGPSVTRRQARADAEAAIVRAVGDSKADEVRARSQLRLEALALRRQSNLESTFARATALLPERVSAEPLDEDWLHEFVNQCQDVSNEEMQSLWARILAGEVSRPGSFSRRTLATVRLLSREEADLFTLFCNYVWAIDGRGYHLDLEGGGAGLMAAGLPFPALVHLEGIGLINYDALAGVVVKLRNAEPHTFAYHQRSFHATIAPDMGDRELRIIPLTAVGQELAPIAGGKPDEDYFTRCQGHLVAEGIHQTPS